MRCRGDLIDLSGLLGIAVVGVMAFARGCSGEQKIQTQEKAEAARVEQLRCRPSLQDGEALVPLDESEVWPVLQHPGGDGQHGERP